MKASNFEKRTPLFLPEQYFEGTIVGGGYFFDRSGNVKARLDVEFTGARTGDGIRIEERPDQNGEEIRRSIHIRKVKEHEYIAGGRAPPRIRRLDAASSGRHVD